MFFLAGCFALFSCYFDILKARKVIFENGHLKKSSCRKMKLSRKLEWVRSSFWALWEEKLVFLLNILPLGFGK